MARRSITIFPSRAAPPQTYRASLNFFDQQGVVVANGLKRYQARDQRTHQGDRRKAPPRSEPDRSHVVNDYLAFNENTGFEGGVFVNMVNFNPTHPVTVTDPATGSPLISKIAPGAQSVRNPVAIANQILDKASRTGHSATRPSTTTSSRA